MIGGNENTTITTGSGTSYFIARGKDTRITVNDLAPSGTTIDLDFDDGYAEINYGGVTPDMAFHNLRMRYDLGSITVTYDNAVDTAMRITNDSAVLARVAGVNNVMQDGDAVKDPARAYTKLDGGGFRLIGSSEDVDYDLDLRKEETLQIREFGGQDTLRLADNQGFATLSYRYADAAITADLNKRTITLDNGWGQMELKGNGKIDELRGTEFDDRMLGTGASELFVASAGNDYVDGRGGADAVSFFHHNGDLIRGLVVDLAAETAKGKQDGAAISQVIRNIEHVGGTAKRDQIFGDEGNNVLRGLTGNDHLVGRAGNDTLIGEAGKDRMLGGRGKDKLLGGDGKDWLNGMGGADLLNGGRGDDTLTGGAASDRFVFKQASGRDVIRDFQAGIDKIDLKTLSVITTKKDLFDNRITEQGDDVHIQLSGNNSIVLLDTDKDELKFSDFLL